MTRSRLLWPTLVLVLAVGAFWRGGRAGWPFVAVPAGEPRATAPVRATEERRVVAEGRVVCYPGSEVVVGAEIGGAIRRLPVREKDAVHKGDLIAELKSDDLLASRAEAAARIAEAEADWRYFDREVRRMERLKARNAGSAFDIDANRRGLEVATARRDSALASRDHFDALIAKARILSPIDGVILARFAQPGETVAPAARLVTVADLRRVRVEAEVDESDAGRVALGDAVTINADGYDHFWHGTVEEVPDAVVARRIQPEDPGRPTDTRVLLVKVTFNEPTLLKLGQRVLVAIRPAGAR
jgi:HlyD family secretion protein